MLCAAWDRNEAQRITRAADKYVLERQPQGYYPTTEENRSLQELRTRRSVAHSRENMGALREANNAVVVRTLGSYARHNAEVKGEELTE